MLGRKTTKLIIVCDEKTREYANYLRQLISVNDDTDDGIVGTADGTVDAAVWTEEEYRNNSATISSYEHILFVGANKTSKSEIGSMSIRFKKFGMTFGWLGKRAMMTVDDTLLTSPEYQNFIEFCASYKQYFERNAYEEKAPKACEEDSEPQNEATEKKREELATLEQPTKKNKMAKALSEAAVLVGKKIIKPVVDVVEAGATGAYENIKNLAMKKKVNDQQYRALTVIFYLGGLNEFLEG